MEQALLIIFKFHKSTFSRSLEIEKNQKRKLLKHCIKRKKIYPPLQKRKQIVTETYGLYLKGMWHDEDECVHLKQQMQQICLHLSEAVKLGVHQNKIPVPVPSSHWPLWFCGEQWPSFCCRQEVLCGLRKRTK